MKKLSEAIKECLDKTMGFDVTPGWRTFDGFDERTQAWFQPQDDQGEPLPGYWVIVD